MFKKYIRYTHFFSTRLRNANSTIQTKVRAHRYLYNILQIIFLLCYFLHGYLKILPSNSVSWITCNEALVYVRPKIPQKLWMEDMNSTNKNRVTKAHVARTLSNTVRLHTLEKRESFYSSKSK